MPPDAAALLTGTHVRLWPYSARHMPRDAVFLVWQALEAEHAWPRIFWWQDLPDAHKGDLVAFAWYMRERVPLLVQVGDNPLAGLIWFDEMVAGLRGNISIWFAKDAWGALAEEAGRLATQYAHQALTLPQVWGVSPWKAARDFAVRCGYSHVATFPRFVRVNGTPRPLYYVVHEVLEP